jgi:hypothetical protein
MLAQNQRNNYFQKYWIGNSSPFEEWELTGYRLAAEVRPDEWVLDVGCGRNPFKDRIDNLVGVDPSFKEADVHSTIEDFSTDQKFDVAFILGSINFGTEDYIRKQIAAVVSHLKDSSRIYWRCNPGNRKEKMILRFIVPAEYADNEEIENFYFPWSKEYHFKFAEEFGFKVSEISWEVNNRIYACWTK